MNLKELQLKVYDAVNPYSELIDLAFIKNSKGITSQVRLSSYQASSRAKMISCIENDFVVTKHFFGETFTTFIESYLKKYPGDTHYINEIGRNLPEYLKINKLNTHPDFIVDLAKLEWLMIESFYNFFNYQTTSPTKAIVPEAKVQSSAIFFKSKWPLHKIWHDEKIYEKKTSNLLIWTTANRRVHIEALDDFMLEVIMVLKKSPSMDQAVEELIQNHKTQKLTNFFSKTLPLWVQKGIIEANL